MPDSVDFSGKPFHFIGIGGIGMSALAYVLAKRQLPVYGSDLKSNHITQRLQKLGVHIFWEQEAKNLEVFTTRPNSAPPESETRQRDNSSEAAIAPQELPQVICSTAINPNNGEYQAAVALGCPIFHRSDVLAALIQTHHSIAVAGTHGKTTTSSLIGYLLLQTGLDPTIVVGGEVEAWSGNARLGSSPYLVAEADESDGSLVKFESQVGVITNIELDHPDRYQSLEEVTGIFRTFAQRCQTTIGCIDCDVVRDRLKPDITYSLDPQRGADYTADTVQVSAEGTQAQIWERGTCLGELHLALLGTHNLSNALAAIAVGRSLGLDFARIAAALQGFEGARRRFELLGVANQIRFIDDYAHHPSEIAATLSAARLQVEGPTSPSRRLVAIFQPHRYSRTQTFIREFAAAFSDADSVIIAPVYGAGEAPIPGVSSGHLAAAIAEHHQAVHTQPTLSELKTFLHDFLQPGDLALFLGAGDLNQIVPDLLDWHRQVEHERDHVQSSRS
ncbi:UDP-N-acetylmuramate--L-alanine ligase [Geitlerinema sp. P-1104]|uniref:UDP-N-acetylmuramate--L-alanine ligase n=1 Tax=Geitlerinema sp. P-1104 TaxID=2546230 RepID=UPI0014769398|nr:UDP-N-acetylmuramate--L-alanine ligase [Geitlerinema sp. P-1104]NMG57381.1 UDP-N-acetylmuramate--L-alanine ligase [Geitlerinema sp. P-1104]